MNAVVVKAGGGHALRLGDMQMVVKEDGTHTRGTLGLAEEFGCHTEFCVTVYNEKMLNSAQP